MIRDWEPAPLIDEKQKKATLEANLGNEDGAPMLVIHSSAGAYVSLEEGKKPDHLNLITTGYLNYQDDKEMLDAAEDCLRECGVGACGPRGFYGTVDSHLNLEARMARFFGTEQAVLYSSGFATITSVIPAFAKADDYVFVDDGISFATQTGVTLARAKTFYFPHNDMQKLEELCEKFANVFADKLHRVFVVIEGLYFNHADIAPLDKILELKKRYVRPKSPCKIWLLNSLFNLCFHYTELECPFGFRLFPLIFHLKHFPIKTRPLFARPSVALNRLI